VDQIDRFDWIFVDIEEVLLSIVSHTGIWLALRTGKEA
jgi:hypothetical protein